MSQKLKLKEDYTLSKCCQPEPNDAIAGYYSYDNRIKIHQKSCSSLENVESERILTLSWENVIEPAKDFEPDSDYELLEKVDYDVLKHHKQYGIDYSLVLARKLNIAKDDAFEIHNKLRDLKLIERVDAKIVQYRKGIVDNKWIKHRNHTYYDLTPKGLNYLEHKLNKDKNNRDE